MATTPALRAIATTIGATVSLNHAHTEFLFLSAMDVHERARLRRHQAVPVTVTEERQLPRQQLLAGGDLTTASPKRVGQIVVEEVKRRLNAQVAKGWAKLCINPGSYGEAEIMRAVKGALLAGTAATNEALKTTIRNPTPMCPATAPHSGITTLSGVLRFPVFSLAFYWEARRQSLIKKRV
ncbi:hypothetical protein BFW01_g616 [Lasiodiplodia theobromae]|nr:hypothetical protein BFW01_g616 [Lasiodiplodia theobromae]